MVIKCKYCEKEIEGILPAPMTCWTCYKKLEHNSEIINNDYSNVSVITTGEGTKQCEKCKRVLPIYQFYKKGTERNELCKDCVLEESAQRCLNSLNTQQLRKMAASGVDAEYLAREWGKTRSTCQSMLASLVKTNYAYKDVVDGKHKYYMKKGLAEKLISEKKEDTIDSIAYLQNHPEVPNESIDESGLTHIMGKGLFIKNVPILKLGDLIATLRLEAGHEFNFEITTSGEFSDIFLSEGQILDWAKRTLKTFIEQSMEANK